MALVTAIALAAPPSPAVLEGATVVDRIAAVVNKSIVLQSEVSSLLEQMNLADPIPPGADVDKVMKARRDEVLDSLVAEKLLEEEVKKLRVDVTKAEVDRVVQGTMAEHGLTEETLQVALQRQGLTLEEYREGLKKQLTKMKIIQLKVKNRVQIDDTEVQAKRAQMKAAAASEYRVRARHLLFLVAPGSDGKVAEAKALAAKARIDNGEKLEDLASTLSEDPGSKERGGDLGVFGRGEMVPEIERTAFSADVDKVAGPVRSPFGWHLILVTERVASPTKSDDAVTEDLRNRLYASEIETQFRAYLDQLKREAHIEKRQ
jgi:parvulin-like peptidyl-prolyl isomerase